MRFRWRWILPVLSLLWFGYESYLELKPLNDYKQQFEASHPGKTYKPRSVYWGYTELRLDPTPEPPVYPDPCKVRDGCVSWDTVPMWVYVGRTSMRMFFLAQLPVFPVAGIFVRIFGYFGGNELIAFLCVMPPLIFLWNWIVGRGIDRWMSRVRSSALK